MNLDYLQGIISPIFDLWIFYKVFKYKFARKDIIFSLIFIALSIIFSFYKNSTDFAVSMIQVIVIIVYFIVIKKQNVKIIFGATLVFELLDLVLGISTTIIELTIPVYYLDAGLVMLIGEILFVILIQINHLIIQRLLTDSNSNIFIGLLLYIYLASSIIYFFVLKDDKLSEVLDLSLGLLVLQITFSIFIYLAGLHIQKGLLTKQEQKNQELELQLLLSKQRAIEIENKQLQEYTCYLDKNEDKLRRFKHDYQNLLDGLRISAQEDDVQAVINQLVEYSASHFNQKALRKYKGVNHIHDKNLKSIAIAKLTKLYDLKIDYSFGCDKDIYQIPRSVDVLDLIRIIGITFDNAIEESQKLINKTKQKNSARVDAMYYQEDGDFEFEIRNRIVDRNIDTNNIQKKNYSTKNGHMGLGLSNVQKIVHKYENSMLVKYSVQNGWFVFNLIVLPDCDGEK
ncbi:MAG: GHKL domain-containing protein [Lactobacillus crispatus]|uniref:GHKL domain-containing protein n=1 Tax=Lactobacillus crispatus TaxID=47770 RepID=UPI003F28C9B3|nr:GHKL domain-containing protein [Lactobacillus crispatus]MCT7861828.1 GHKL domain-containing protein [Lactobacillus crispatus]